MFTNACEQVFFYKWSDYYDFVGFKKYIEMELLAHSMKHL